MGHGGKAGGGAHALLPGVAPWTHTALCAPPGLCSLPQVTDLGASVDKLNKDKVNLENQVGPSASHFRQIV
jgi:hypothetical protein